MRAGWVTDVHLNFVPRDKRHAFYAQIRAEALDVLLLGGDIGEANSVAQLLAEIKDALRIPIYFVLGNHDFYRSSIREVRSAVEQLTARSRWLRWLPASGVIRLTGDCALVGHDGWADGRVGDFFGSDVLLNDYILIQELRRPAKQDLYAQLNALGDEAAAYLDRHVRAALQRYPKILVLTHVPPFRDACWHEGRISDTDYLPNFVCGAAGERLTSIMREHPEHRMTVLCGHTHGSGSVNILDNLLVLTGGAVYGSPCLQKAADVEHYFPQQI